jgi:aryl sulfotransferase
MPHLPPGIVWLASYPKSGNTWVRLLLSNFRAGAATPDDINNLSFNDGIASARSRFERQTLVDSFLLTAAEIERMRPAVHDADAAEWEGPGFIKTHDAWTRSGGGRPVLGGAARAALYMVRDPRDVAVSYAFHQDCATAKVISQMVNPDEDMGGGRLQVGQRLGGWSGHVRSWLDQDDLPTHVIRYEDLRADTAGVFARALDFLGAEYTEEDVARAVRHARFEELRAQEAVEGFRERISKGAPFFREGRVGGWRDHLSAEQARTVERDHGPMMARLGYDADGDKAREKEAGT